MPKQNQAIKQKEKPNQQKNKPAITNEQAESQGAENELLKGLIQVAPKSSMQTQIGRLSDRRFLPAQSQAFAAQIGHMGGNHHLQKVMAQLNSPQTSELQRAPNVSKEQNLPAPRNEIELIGMRLKSRQVDLQYFLTNAKSDVERVRHYFEWVNGVYTRCYGHYKLVLAQANAEADSAQAWIDFIVGVLTGVSVGVLFELTLAARATEMGIELLSEAGAEMVEGGLGRVIKLEVPKATLLEELTPELKQIRSLQNLDRLNATVLAMAIPGAYVYTDPIIQAERLTAELRVAEAGGKRRMSDTEIKEQYLKLMNFELKSVQMESALKNAESKFALLREYANKPAPTDQRCEQDIWIPWLAKQNIDTFLTPILFNGLIRRHLVDIGLAGWESKGGRLNVKVGDIKSGLFEPRASEIIEVETICRELKAAAAKEAATLPAYWKNVFLLG